MILAIDALALAWWWRSRRDHRYDVQIEAAARRYGIDASLVKAVVWRESRFDAAARGAAGEVGLMQIREPAALEWAAAERVGGFHAGLLADPATNTLCGTWYLAKLLRRYDGADDPAVYALADYNAGRTHVLRWNKGAAATNSLAFLSQVTFPGTQEYIRSVIARRRHYGGPVK